MALNHFIAHRITRANPSQSTTIDLRNAAWNIDGKVDELFREMKTSFTKRAGKEYGRFSDDRAAHPVASWLEEFIEGKLGFESFSKKVTQQLKSELDKTGEPFEALLAIAHETLEGGDFLHLFIVQHHRGIYIDGDLDIAESLHLDTAGIRLAAKVNIADWQNEEAHRQGNALCLIRWRGEKELSEVFANSIGFAEKIDLSAETEAFLEAVKDYTKHLPTEVSDHTKNQVVEYCLQKESEGKPVVIEELSTTLEDTPTIEIEKPYSPPPKLANFIAEKNPKAKPELIPDKQQMKNFVRISGRDETMSMSFASACLGNSIVYDPDTDSLVIKNIPKSLKSRLKKHITGLD